MKTPLVLTLAMLTGCAATHEYGLRQQAAFDVKCPIAQVRVLDWGPWAQSAHVDACGKPLEYHNVGQDVAQWVPVTPAK